MRLLCPTRWTVQADTLTSVISNYEVLLETWEEAVDVVKDTETKARINVVFAQMQTRVFICYFSWENGLTSSDNLRATIQKKTTSAAEGQQLAQLVLLHFNVHATKMLNLCINLLLPAGLTWFTKSTLNNTAMTFNNSNETSRHNFV